METDVLILPMIPVPSVYDFAITFLNHPDKEFRLDNRVTWGKHPDWSVAVQALVNHRPDLSAFSFWPCSSSRSSSWRQDITF